MRFSYMPTNLKALRKRLHAPICLDCLATRHHSQRQTAASIFPAALWWSTPLVETLRTFPALFKVLTGCFFADRTPRCRWSQDWLPRGGQEIRDHCCCCCSEFHNIGCSAAFASTWNSAAVTTCEFTLETKDLLQSLKQSRGNCESDVKVFPSQNRRQRAISFLCSTIYIIN